MDLLVVGLDSLLFHPLRHLCRDLLTPPSVRPTSLDVVECTLGGAALLSMVQLQIFRGQENPGWQLSLVFCSFFLQHPKPDQTVQGSEVTDRGIQTSGRPSRALEPPHVLDLEARRGPRRLPQSRAADWLLR